MKESVSVKVKTSNPVNIDIVAEALGDDFEMRQTSQKVFDGKTGNWHQYFQVWVK